MNAHHGSKTSLGLVVTAAVITIFAAGCERLDDIADEILRAADAGVKGDANTPPQVCADDSDCRVFSDYCTGCDCRALGVKQPDAVCGGPGVQCFADPCRGKSATCQAGRCTLVTACTSSESCAASELCTVETGTCNRPPGCGPNAICPAVCYGTCQPRGSQGERCGAAICPAGQLCCNASCGVCTPPGGACTQQFCQ